VASEERPISKSTQHLDERATRNVYWPPRSGSTATPSHLDEGPMLGIPDGQYLALAPGEELELSNGLDIPEKHRQAIFIGCGEVVVQDHVHGFHTTHYRLPSTANDGAGIPTVAKVVVNIIHNKPIGWKSLGDHLILFLDSHDAVITRLDSSVEYGFNSDNTWEFNLIDLEKLCIAGGLGFEIKRFETARRFLTDYPQWAPPKLEFEVDHLPAERVREWSKGVALGLVLAGGFGVAGGFLIWLGPIGWITRALGIVGIVVAVALTIWSHSKWRMRRSLRKHHLGTG
jgi:hypothetical protein